MENTKTKKALIMSVLSMVLCIAMLIGMTFAWFTDTASTGVNKIQAGNLNVELEMYDGSRYVNISKNPAPIFGSDTSTVAQNKNLDTLWEPGKTQIAYLAIKNEGNLALKYKVALNVTNPADGKNLYKVMEYAIAPDAKGGMTAPAWTSGKSVGTGTQLVSDNDVSLAAGDTHYFALLVHMDEQAGNEYQGGKVDFDLSVLATQDTVESDSYNNQYDKAAAYPTIASNSNEANDAIQNSTTKDVTIKLTKSADIALDNGIANAGASSRDITFVGDGTQTVDVVEKAVNAEGGELNYQRGSTFTFENLTVQAGKGNFDGIVCDELTYKNCTIKGKLTLYGKATFINCTFENDMANQYSIWTWGGTDVTFSGCTFNTNGKAILLYGQATAAKPTNLVVDNCEFNDRRNGAAGKAAIEIGNDYNATYTLTINNMTVNGFAEGKNTGSKLWANKNSMDAAHLTVTIDGTKVQ